MEFVLQIIETDEKDKGNSAINTQITIEATVANSINTVENKGDMAITATLGGGFGVKIPPMANRTVPSSCRSRCRLRPPCQE